MVPGCATSPENAIPRYSRACAWDRSWSVGACDQGYAEGCPSWIRCWKFPAVGQLQIREAIREFVLQLGWSFNGATVSPMWIPTLPSNFPTSFLVYFQLDFCFFSKNHTVIMFQLYFVMCFSFCFFVSFNFPLFFCRWSLAKADSLHCWQPLGTCLDNGRLKSAKSFAKTWQIEFEGLENFGNLGFQPFKLLQSWSHWSLATPEAIAMWWQESAGEGQATVVRCAQGRLGQVMKHPASLGGSEYGWSTWVFLKMVKG